MFVLLQLQFHANVLHFAVVFPGNPRLGPLKWPEKVCNTWQFLAATWPVLISCFLCLNFSPCNFQIDKQHSRAPRYLPTLSSLFLCLYKIYIFAWKSRSWCQKNIFILYRIFVLALAEIRWQRHRSATQKYYHNGRRWVGVAPQLRHEQFRKLSIRKKKRC